MRLVPAACIVAALAPALWAHPALGAELRVYAAISLTDALQEIAAAYGERTADTVTFNFGASSALARQIQKGAPADIFFAADEEKMDELAAESLLLAGTRRSLLSNSLAIVVSANGGPELRSARDLAEPRTGRIAIAEPQSAPAGIYARQYLQRLGLWAQLAAKLVPTENVRAALAAVASGNVDAGIVYKSDAAASTKVRIAVLVPAAEGPRISYPVAVLRDAAHPEAARRFVSYLASEPAVRVFRKHGFLPLPEGGATSP